MSIKTAISAGVIVVCVIASVGLLAVRGVTLSQLGSQYNDNTQAIETLQVKLQTLSVENKASVEVIQADLSSAATAGKAVADLQMQYDQINISSAGGPAAFAENALKIDAYLSDSNQRVPWYNVKIKDVTPEWVFESTYNFSGDTVPVLWTCKASDNKALLAYTTGVYDTKKNEFKDVSYHMTQLGSSYVQGTPAVK